MDLETLKQILDLVREHELTELEVEQDGIGEVRKDARSVGAAPRLAPSAPSPPTMSSAGA